jgi:hypothetical protein
VAELGVAAVEMISLASPAQTIMTTKPITI